MKAAITSLLILALSCGVALAETPDRTVIRPPADVKAPADPVRRADPEAMSMGLVALAPAEVAQVDKNRDGKISFAELLLHDMKFDF